jgi:hypothetical protein
MDKRRFLSSVGAGAGLLGASTVLHAAPGAPERGPALLTVSGGAGKGNRGPVDAALDQLMVKHKVQFASAHAFDAAMLATLPAVTIRPTLEYDEKVHALRGPLLTTVLGAAGTATGDTAKIRLRAIDGYAVDVTGAKLREYRMIVATQIDGRPLPLGGLGPQWAVYDADRLADFRDKPVKERFALCPWGLYHVEVLAG